MTPYYQDAQATIWLGDCSEILPTIAEDSVDMILWDPPYGVAWDSGKHRQKPFGQMQGDDGTFPTLEILGMALRTLHSHHHVYCFELQSWGTLPIGGRAELVWDKGILGLGDLSLPWGPQHEKIAFGVYVPSKSNRADNYGRLAARMRQGSVLREDRANSGRVKWHPTEKPVGILRRMIEASSLIGDIVLDPTIESGSTAVAARLEGRRCIGIEIEERYAEIAAKRLQQQVMVFDEVVTEERAQQGALLGD